VVGAAVVRDGRLLVQRRGWPADAAGRWELPGGGVEDGESEAAALVRECREELGIEVLPGERVGEDVPLPNGRVLRIYAATSDGEPSAVEHEAVRWVGPGELAGLDWLEADRVLVPDLIELVSGRGPHERRA